MDIEKMLQSKEVKNQSFSDAEMKKFLLAFGVYSFENWEGRQEVLPLFKLLKTVLVDYGLSQLKNTFFELDKSPSNQLTIFDDANVLDACEKIEIKLEELLEEREE